MQISEIERLAKEKRIKVKQYSIQDIKDSLSDGGVTNKKGLPGLLSGCSPELAHEYNSELGSRNPYYVRMFEAVGLAYLYPKQQ